MSKRHGSYIDAKPPVRTILSTLWTSMLFVFAYVDIFGFWRADVIRGALAKKVPGSGFVIDQRFLLLTTIYILIPALMIAATMLMPAPGPPWNGEHRCQRRLPGVRPRLYHWRIVGLLPCR